MPPRSLLLRLTDHHLQIIANRAPIGFEAEFVNTRGNNTMYRGILLPFSSDDETIDFIYGVINWKEVAPDAVVAAVEAEVARNAPASAPRPMVPVWADGPSAAVRTHPPEPENDEYGDELNDQSASMPGEGEALADWLAAARVTADAALTADTRGRTALYRALGGAYDFALVAETRAAEYAALLADARISVQERAPMPPIAKLIFGRDYDKTRLTEFAATLSYARRRELPHGGMQMFLENFPGGLKAVVATERRARRPEGKPVKPDLTREAARASRPGLSDTVGQRRIRFARRAPRRCRPRRDHRRYSRRQGTARPRAAVHRRLTPPARAICALRSSSSQRIAAAGFENDTDARHYGCRPRDRTRCCL